MDDAVDDAVDPMGLVATEALVAGHLAVEDALFTLCGAWSTDPATGGSAAGGEVQAFLATQSALHAWRAEQWERRRPRSVGGGASGGDGGRRDVGASDLLPAGWVEALSLARAHDDGATRLACWVVALQPCLAARYAAHQQRLAPAADSGLRRWLAMASDDVLHGLAEGAELLSRAVEPRRRAATAAAASEVLGPLLGS